jgi:CHAT domain-containing protein
MHRHTPAPTLLRLARLCAGSLMLLATQAMAASAADERIQHHCAGAPPLPEPTPDLARFEREADELQERNDPRAMVLACQAWTLLQRDRGPDHIDTVRWAGNIGIGLFLRGDLDDARRVLMQAWQRATALGPEAAHLARRNASILSMTYMQRQQMGDALLWSGRGVDTLPPDGPPDQDSVRLRIAHATLLSLERRHDDARTLFERVLRDVQARPADFVPETAYVLHQWAVAEQRRGNLAEALRLNTENLAFQRHWTPHNRLNLALATHNQGLLLRALARFDEAEALLREALDTSRDATTPDLMQNRASIRDTLASLLVERGRPAEALPLAQEAVQLLQAGPEAGTAAMVRPLRRLAEVQTATGDLASAVRTWRQALALIDARSDAGDAETRNLARLSHTRLMLLLGNHDEAERTLALADAEARTKPGQPASERAERQRLHALLQVARGQREQALGALAAADAAWAELHGPDHPERLRVAALTCDLGQGCDKLLGQAPAADVPPDAVALQALALAQWARRGARTELADDQARRALLAAEAAASPHLQWMALAEYAQQQAQAGRLAEASFFGKRALGVVQALRDNLQASGAAADQAFVRDKTALYRHVADWLLRQQRVSEALQTLHLLKRHEQADFNERAGPPTGAVPLTDAERQWLDLIDQATDAPRALAAEVQRLLDLQRRKRITPQEQQRLADLQQQMAQGRAQARPRLDATLAALRSAAATRAPAAGAAPALTSNVPGELQAWLMQVDDELVMLFAGAGRQWVHRSPQVVPLAADIAALLDRLQHRQPALELQRTLYERVGRPLDQAAQAVGARRVLVWLDGALRYLPLGVLHDGQRHLASKLVLRSSGAGLATAMAAQPARQPARLHAFGVTRAHAGLPALPAVADELCTIVDGPVRGLEGAAGSCQGGGPMRGRGRLPGQADADQRFTEAELRGASQQAQLLHIGTHFVLRPGSVSQSWLLLGDGQRLPLQRLQGLDLGAPELVTLSACDTALPGASGDGREIDGLAAAWLGKGAAQVLASLWRVDDRSTARFMQRFYAELARVPGDAALALHRTQQAAADAGQAPWQWAAFTLLARP